ncbi:MAG: FtsX-like permease family protein, partial [Clostridia bacterium]|nr:FtsX-like permease family protein [Clostridia bacterium]
MRYALRNILRLKTRSFLTFAIAFAILFLSMFGILTVRLCEDNRERFFGPLDGSVHVTDEQYKPFFTYEAAEHLNQNSESITKIAAVMERDVSFWDITYLGKGEYFRNRFDSERVYYPPGTQKVEYHEGFLICAVTSMDILQEVYSGALVMIEGTMITEKNSGVGANKIVISSAVAEKNGLKLGDRVKLDPFSVFEEEEAAVSAYWGFRSEYAPYEYIVSGIYENREDNVLSASVPSEINENKVYIPISTLPDMSKDSYLLEYGLRNENRDCFEAPSVVPDQLYFYTENMRDIKILEEKINAIGFSKNMCLSPYLSDAASSPSARLSEIITMLLIGVSVLGFLIFALASLFNMKARHRELAVLTALGQKRSRIALSFFSEICILTFSAFILGILLLTGAVSVFAVPISNYLYEAEISAKITNESADLFLIGNGT